MPSTLARWKMRARQLQAEVYALYLAYRDPRVPWYAKAVAACVVGYALSPIDLIPDFIPVLGYLDDLVLIPLGIALVLRMIPPAVMDRVSRTGAVGAGGREAGEPGRGSGDRGDLAGAGGARLCC